MSEDGKSGGGGAADGNGDAAGGKKPSSGKARSGSPLGMFAQAEGMVQMAIALPLGCVIGWLLGDWADRAWHQSWIGIFGVALGAVGGFLQIYRIASKYIKDDK